MTGILTNREILRVWIREGFNLEMKTGTTQRSPFGEDSSRVQSRFRRVPSSQVELFTMAIKFFPGTLCNHLRCRIVMTIVRDWKDNAIFNDLHRQRVIGTISNSRQIISIRA
jgi:hypothetical protein